MNQLHQNSDIQYRTRLKQVRETSLNRRVSKTLGTMANLLVNYCVPVAGLLPLTAQIYLRDHTLIFKQLEPRAVVSASAIILLAFGMLGLYDIIGGTILIEGIGITYPFPQKEFGEDVIRHMPLIQLGRESTVVFFVVLTFDSVARLIFNHLVNRPMGFLGSFGALISDAICLLGGTGEVDSSLVELKEKMQAEKNYQERVAELHWENRQRGAATLLRFLARRAS